MGRKKISEMTAVTALAGDDTYEVVQSGVNKKVTKKVSGTIPIADFSTELTFDVDKELATVTGGTRTLTKASSGNLNGVCIMAKFNTPVAVNFPAGSEAINGSDSISTTDMNIVIMRYFADYDGAGNSKIIYMIKNQTAV